MARRRWNAPGPAQEVLAPMQAGSSQLLLTTGVSTRTFDVSRSAEFVTASAASAPVPLLTQYVAIWLEGIEGLVRPRTVEAYARRLDLHVLPLLGERRLDAIRIDDIVGLVAGLRSRLKMTVAAF
jgi:Phage integrase, N-terminal SAM-like domain